VAYRIDLAASARRQLAKLPQDVQSRAALAIDALADNPRHAGSKKLAGQRNRYRVRVGAYRVVYEIHDAVLLVLVVEVGHRREVYR
jgi:mRNA interferase RelE/StbE